MWAPLTTSTPTGAADPFGPSARKPTLVLAGAFISIDAADPADPALAIQPRSPLKPQLPPALQTRSAPARASRLWCSPKLSSQPTLQIQPTRCTQSSHDTRPELRHDLIPTKGYVGSQPLARSHPHSPSRFLIWRCLDELKGHSQLRDDSGHRVRHVRAEVRPLGPALGLTTLGS